MEKTLRSYLEIKDVDYSLFINGKWGSGKTYFIKNELELILTQYKLKPFYCTVNGVSNSVELHELIASTCLSNYFTPMKIPIFGALRDRVSTILKSISSAHNIIKALKFSDFHFPDKTIIIVDDIERISPNYCYEELLGYINREFIEHNNFKVILIGDESQDRIKNSNFSTIREKYIRWAVNFKSDIDSVIKSFIKSFNSDVLYLQHLTNHESDILAIIKEFEIRNFRTLKFFFEIYNTIFNASSKEHVILYKDLIYFTLIISNEYRNGNLEIFKSSSQLPQVVTQEELTPLLYLNKETNLLEDKSKPNVEQEKILNFESGFKKYSFNRLTLYDLGVSYFYIQPIYDLITTGEWDSENYRIRLKELLRIKKPFLTKVPNENINKLVSYQELKENELDEATEKVIEQIKNQELDFNDFCKAFNYLIYLSQQKILAYSEEYIRELLLKESNNLTISTSGQENYIEYARHEIVIEIEKFSPEASQILKDKFNYFNQSINRKDALQKLENWDDDIDIFDKKNYQIYRSIMDNCESKLIINKISNDYQNRQFLSDITKTIKEHYRSDNAGDYYFDDIPKLNEIKEALINRDWGKVDRLDNYFLDILTKQIDLSVKNIENTKSM